MDPIGTPSGGLTPLDGLVQLSRLLFSDDPVETLLDRLAHLSQQTVAQADHVSVTLIDGDGARTVVFTSDLAQELDERQYESGSGPCTDAAISGRTITVALAEPDITYPQFVTAARRVNILHTLSVALPAPDRIIGAINFYSSNAEAFDGQAVELAEVFASYAAVVLLNSASYHTTADLPDQVRHAFRSRISVETAKGVLMARHGVSDQEAFTELQRRAHLEQRAMPQVAQSILNGTSAPGMHDHQG
jgi:GAF domain-containing protein